MGIEKHTSDCNFEVFVFDVLLFELLVEIHPAKAPSDWCWEIRIWHQAGKSPLDLAWLMVIRYDFCIVPSNGNWKTHIRLQFWGFCIRCTFIWIASGNSPGQGTIRLVLGNTHLTSSRKIPTGPCLVDGHQVWFLHSYIDWELKNTHPIAISQCLYSMPFYLNC